MTLEYFHLCLPYAMYDYCKNRRKCSRIIGDQIHELTLRFWCRSRCKKYIWAIYHRCRENNSTKNYRLEKNWPLCKSSQNFQAYKSMRVKKEIWLPIFYKWYRLEAKQAKIKLPDYWVNYTQAENPTELWNNILKGVLIDFNYVLDRFWVQIRTQDTWLPLK